MPRNHVSYLGARAPQLVNVFIWAWVLTRNAQVPMESQKMLKRHDQRSFDSGLIISQRADIDEKWFRNFAQGDRWNFSLTAGTLVPANQEIP
jgi:hypothetical protein